MGRRRRRMRRKPRTGPGHNEQNRQTRASRQKSLLLDQSKEDHFRFYAEEAFDEKGIDGATWRPLLQTLWTRGTREGIDDALDWLDERVDEGKVDEDTADVLTRLLKRYTTKR